MATLEDYLAKGEKPKPGTPLDCMAPGCKNTYPYDPTCWNRKTCSDACRKARSNAVKRGDDSFASSTPDEIIQREKERARQRVENDQLAKALKERSYQELLFDNLRTSIMAAGLVFPEEFRKVDVPAPKTRKFKEEEATLLLSDIHIGKEIRVDEMGGLGAYNFEYFIEYAIMLAKAIKEIIRIHSYAYKIKKLNVLGLGDWLDSQGIYPGQANYLDLTVTQQAVFGMVYIAQLLVSLLDTFQQIDVELIMGNHGRTGQKKREQPRYNSYDFLAYTMLSLMLQQQKRIKFNVHVPFWGMKNIKGHDFLMLHGDDIRSWAGIPWYGINRAIANLREVLMNIGKGSFRYTCLAHFHNTGDLEANYGERLINGAWTGCDPFSLEALFSSSQPRQQFFGVNETRGITWRYWVDLRDANFYEAPKEDNDVPSK